MAKKTQKTQKTPQGAEIPIPKRGDFFADLKKISTPDKSKSGGAKK